MIEEEGILESGVGHIDAVGDQKGEKLMALLGGWVWGLEQG